MNLELPGDSKPRHPSSSHPSPNSVGVTGAYRSQGNGWLFLCGYKDLIEGPQACTVSTRACRIYTQRTCKVKIKKPVNIMSQSTSKGAVEVPLCWPFLQPTHLTSSSLSFNSVHSIMTAFSFGNVLLL